MLNVWIIMNHIFHILQKESYRKKSYSINYMLTSSRKYIIKMLNAFFKGTFLKYIKNYENAESF